MKESREEEMKKGKDGAVEGWMSQRRKNLTKGYKNNEEIENKLDTAARR